MLYLKLAAGLVLLLLSGELLVRGAVSVASRLGVSALFIGMVLVGFGTSMPELMASVLAALAQTPGIAVGNVVGSNIANVLLILGVAGLIAALPCDPRAYARDSWALLGTAIMLMLMGQLDRVGRPLGLGLVLLLLLYITYTYHTERARPNAAARLHEAEAETVLAAPKSLVAGLLLVGLSLAGVIAGARLLVDSAVLIAQIHGVSKSLVGVTVVAVGTSLPELAVGGIAAYRGRPEVAVGSVVGSNIYNVLFVLGVTAIVQPFGVPQEIVSADLWVMLGATLALLIFLFTGWRINRLEATVFLAAYGVYVGMRWL